MTQEAKMKKCRSPSAANRYVKKMLAQGWTLAGPVTRSGVVNKRYVVTLVRDSTPPSIPPRPV
jgi:hypothetical protein